MRAIRAARTVGAKEVKISRDGEIIIEFDPTQPLPVRRKNTPPKASSQTVLSDFTPSGDIRRFTPEEYEHYRQLPQTKQRRLDEDIERRWREQLPSKPYNKRERDALLLLATCEADVLLLWKNVNLTLTAAERLEARGFLEIRYKEPDRLAGFVLKRAGLEAAKIFEAGETDRISAVNRSKT